MSSAAPASPFLHLKKLALLPIIISQISHTCLQNNRLIAKTQDDRIRVYYMIVLEYADDTPSFYSLLKICIGH